MIVRDDVSVGTDDDARPAAPLLLRLLGLFETALRDAEEFEERIKSASSAETAVTARFDLFGYFDVHDAFNGVLGRIGQVGILVRFV